MFVAEVWSGLESIADFSRRDRYCTSSPEPFIPRKELEEDDLRFLQCHLQGGARAIIFASSHPA
jgi:hypothetical protein